MSQEITREQRRRNTRYHLAAVFVSIGAISPALLGNSHANEAKVAAMAPCDLEISTTPNINEQAAAQRCIQDRMGKVAMVVFGDSFKPAEIDAFARDTRDILADGTAGLIDVEIEPLVAPDDANLLLRGRNPFKTDGKACTDSETLTNTAAYIADETMDLNEYDFIVGVDDRQACSDVGGVASPEYAKRYVNTFGDWSGGVASTAAHELGHAFDLPHGDAARRIEAISSSGFAIGRQIETTPGRAIRFFTIDSHLNQLRSDNGLVDLRASLLSFTADNFDGYGGVADLMGKQSKDLLPKSTDIWRLQWPERLLGTAPDTMKILNGGEVSIKKPTEDIHDFAVLDLDESVTLAVGDRTDGNPETKTYDKLVFDPVDTGFDNDVVHVYLLQEGNQSTLTLGCVSLAAKEFDEIRRNNYTVVIGDQAVRLQIAPDRTVTYSDVSGKKTSTDPANKAIGTDVAKAPK